MFTSIVYINTIINNVLHMRLRMGYLMYILQLYR